jgi:thioredoxin 1
MLTIKYFTAVWCGPCKMFGPTFDQVMNETGVQFNKIDVDTSSELVSKYMISSVPTIIFEIGENIVYRQSGIMSRGQLISTIQQFS